MKLRNYSKLNEDEMEDAIPLVEIRNKNSPTLEIEEHLKEMRSISINTSNLIPKLLSPDNIVLHSKYNLFSFLPLVLFDQFKYFYNLYFLLIGLSPLIPDLKTGEVITFLGPLIFVLGFTMISEAMDDYKRHQRDLELNQQRYTKLTIQTLDMELGYREELVASSSLRVGDFILLDKDCRVPADLLLLWTLDESNSCFIRTDQLDGETDWKLRIPPSIFQQKKLSEIIHTKLKLEYPEPEKDIYRFEGRITILNGQQIQIPLSLDQTVWTNTVLASSRLLGLVIYTGIETRASLNTTSPNSKIGLIDQELNQITKVLFVTTAIISFIMILCNMFKGLWWITYLRFMILLSSIIPISLRVNLEMGKYLCSKWIANDPDLRGAAVRTSTIPEELGRISYLLTDKTGTLTQNIMEMKKVHLGVMAYTKESMDDFQSNILYVYFHTLLDEFTSKAKRSIINKCNDFVDALSVCHNVTPVIDHNTGSVAYQASSPDEIAIVKWLSEIGVQLVQRERTNIKIVIDPPKNNLGEYQPVEIKYDILHIFPFSSNTKRMSILVKPKHLDEVWFIVKGADTVLSLMVQRNDWLDEECTNLAQEGLRTLVVARKKLSLEGYERFKKELLRAELSLTNRQLELDKVVANLESDLELLGITAVEDKLQNNVKSTLESLRNAGLKIWMLTGDKVETAICIAISTKLVARGQKMEVIQGLKHMNQCEYHLGLLYSKLDYCLVIDGQSLQLFLDHFKQEFLDLCCQLSAVVCSRVSPTQKALVAESIAKLKNKRVCCIGDGGNDVSMIQKAHVGIGLQGLEGNQASLAADYSITQFQHLTKLLVWHGRNSYKRMSKLSQFVIHRGLVISVMQVVFSSIIFFAPIALYQGWLLVGYTSVFTMFPVFSLMWNIDVDESVVMTYPELYKDMLKGRILSYRTFFEWLTISVYQGGCIMLLGLFFFDSQFVSIISITFTALIFNELLMIVSQVEKWHRYMFYSILLSLLFYSIAIFTLKNDLDPQFIFSLPFAIKTTIITSVSCAPLFLFNLLSNWLNPPIYDKLN